MARSPNAVAAQERNKAKRASRPVGPRTLWIVLRPGSDAAAIREQIESVTFNGREVLKTMGTGETPAVIKMQIASETRGKNGGGQDDAEVVEGVTGGTEPLTGDDRMPGAGAV